VRCNSYAPRVLQDVVHKDLVGIPPTSSFGSAWPRSQVSSLRSRRLAARSTPPATTRPRLPRRCEREARDDEPLRIERDVRSSRRHRARVVLGSADTRDGDPYLFQSIAAAVIGGISILGGRGNYLGTVAGAISLVALISLLQAENMPDYGRSIVYGVAILVVLVLFGREERV